MISNAATLLFGPLQAQTQKQTISPRLQHAVRLLQMSSMEFAQTLAETLDRNPFLESADGEDEGISAPLGALCVLADGSAQWSPDDAVMTQPPRAETGERAEGELSHSDSCMAADYELPDEWLNEAPGWADGVPGAAPGAHCEHSTTDLITGTASLQTHLHSQLNLLPLGPRDMALAKVVVESLDDDGYLRADPLDLLTTVESEPDATAEDLKIALRRVQSLEPAGVGARSLQECLLLQLDKIACPVRRAQARCILTEHLRLLAAHDTAGLARKLGCTVPDTETACREIRRFDPRPGSGFGSPKVQYITPDVIARRAGRRWVAMLNPAVVPRLRLSQGTIDLYQRHRGSVCPALSTHLQEARWTLRNVEQRFSTIMAVAQAILDRQHHFLEYGEMAMKPLALREIGNDVGVHESTVSRVTNNKFIATPVGVFELERFFSRAMLMPSGNACSGTAIRSLVRDIIEGEPRAQPLSDADITRELSRQGLTVARRTVTKYRQGLRIEPVAMRRAVAAGAATAMAVVVA